MANDNDFDKIPQLATANRKGKNAVIAIFDGSEGAGIEPRKVTPKVLFEMAAPHQGIKGHEVGDGNTHVGNNSITYGEDNVTGLTPRPFTNAVGSNTIVIAGVDVTDDYRTGDGVRLMLNADESSSIDVIINSSVFGTNTTIVVDTNLPTGIVSGTIMSFAHGNGVMNIGQNNQIKGNSGYYVGVGGRVKRDVTGFQGGGVRNEASHVGAVMAGHDGQTNWCDEQYLSYVARVAKGDRKRSQVLVGALTTDATPTDLLLSDGTALILPTGASAKLTIEGCGTQISGAAGTPSDSYGVKIEAIVKNIGGTITIVNQVTAYEDGDAPFAGTITLDKDDTAHTIKVVATGQASKNIVWTAEVTLVMHIV